MQAEERSVSILPRKNRKLIRPVLSVAVAYCFAIQMLLAAMLGALTIQQAAAGNGYPVICYGASVSQDDDGSKESRLHMPPCVLCALGAVDAGSGPAIVLTASVETSSAFGSLLRDQAIVARPHSPRMSQGPPSA